MSVHVMVFVMVFFVSCLDTYLGRKMLIQPFLVRVQLQVYTLMREMHTCMCITCNIHAHMPATRIR
jgi:hypothetical protein